MSFQDDRYSERKSRPIHPVWRGVGCLFMVIIPVMSYVIAMLLIDQNKISHWLPVPYDLLSQPGNFLYFGDPMIYIKIIVTVTIAFVFYVVFVFATFLINSLFGVSRYRTYDLPPVKKPRGVKIR